MSGASTIGAKEEQNSGLGRTGIDPLSRLAVFALFVTLTLVGIRFLRSHLSGSLALRAGPSTPPSTSSARRP